MLIHPEFVKYRDYPAWSILSLHRINSDWKQPIRNPFQIHSFFEYCIERYCVPKNMNPCAEIAIGKREVCSIQVGRKIESPFSLTSFTELYEIGPWEAEHPMMRAMLDPEPLLRSVKCLATTDKVLALLHRWNKNLD